MNKWIFLLSITAASMASAADMSKTCLVATCNPGDKAVTYSTKSDFFYACQTRELSEYTNTAIGIAAVMYQLTGKLPNISPETGDPELEGENGELIATLRSKAKVSTFDEALQRCEIGKNKQNVLIMNNPEDSHSIWVSTQGKSAFWMPKGFLNKR
ncbi:hypothetical protein [Pseudomonas extremaustralis]|uniref:hypothetical protein n=1 Tax=Pseudomonas extremaustralis TaxID=359110 RepID=UPI00285CDF7A|nr:hypothetical protein [Pseudomonas extremaustralis]MDR6579968.1 hypothetical protein [Pseudomonas extremaustralis]